MKANQNLVCHHCSYDANAANATQCEACGRQLGGTRFRHRQLPLRLSAKSSLLWLSLLPLVLVGGGYLLWANQRQQNQVWQQTTDSRLESQQNQVLQQTTESHSTNIQLYNSMREVQNVPEGLFYYTSAPQFAPLVSHGVNQAITQAHPKFRLRFKEPVNNIPGSGTAIAMVLDGWVSFGETARPVEDTEYNKARERNFALEQIPVGFDGVVFYTHRHLPITGLSVKQLQAIFRGKVTKWKEVGGPDIPIVPISLEPEATSTIKLLFANLKSASLGRNVQIVRDYTQEMRKVAATPGGISYGSIATVVNQHSIRPLALAKGGSKQYVQPFTSNNQVNAEAIQNGSYPLTKRLFVVIRRDGLLDEQAGVAYANLLLSTEGQHLIKKAGFVAIRP